MTDLGLSVARLLLGSARAAGLDPAVHAPLTGAATVLGADQITVYTATNPPHPTDASFLADVSDAEDDARDLLTAAGRLADRVTAALDAALADDEDADNNEDEDEAAERIGRCEAALGLLAEIEKRLSHAVSRLEAVAPVLGETYESVYSLLRRGGLMPFEGRWIEGEDDTAPGRPRRRRHLGARPRSAAADPVGALRQLGALWSPDFDAYASGRLSASEVRCALCLKVPCKCPPFGTPAYFALVDQRHGHR
jgi:hypothetical protein